MSNEDYSWVVPEGMVPPVEIDERTCFGIVWFDTEEAADAYAKVVTDKGTTYNGGWFHGMPCGRDKSWDRDGLFAVTH